MFCTSCGKELKKDSAVCSSCGAPNAASAGSTLTIQASNQPIVVLSGKTPKEKFTKFLFITSMIFMIFFAIRAVTGLAGISTWNTIKNDEDTPADLTDIISQIYNSVMFNVVIIVITFALVLAFFIMITSLRGNQDRTTKQKVKLSKAIFIFSIIVTALGVAYLISDCVILSQLNEFIDKATGHAQIDQDVLAELDGSMTGALVFDVTFIAFCIVNIMKSWKLFKVLKTKDQETAPAQPVIAETSGK